MAAPLEACTREEQHAVIKVTFWLFLVQVNLNLHVKVKVKLSLCFNGAPRNEGELGEWTYSSTHSLASALDGGEWLVSRPGRFTPGKEPLVPIA
jgi:hypothetical protein